MHIIIKGMRTNFLDVYIYEEGFSYPETKIVEWREKYIYERSRRNSNILPRMDSLLVWRLLEVACRKSLGVELNSLNPRRLETKKPIIDYYHISLSHDRGFFMVAISSHPVGVDIQEERPSSHLKYNGKCWTEEERKLLSKNDIENFKYWTRKEALYKLIDPGICFHNDMEMNQINTADSKWANCFLDGEFNRYHWSIVSELIKKGIKPNIDYWFN